MKEKIYCAVLSLLALTSLSTQTYANSSEPVVAGRRLFVYPGSSDAVAFPFSILQLKNGIIMIKAGDDKVDSYHVVSTSGDLTLTLTEAIQYMTEIKADGTPGPVYLETKDAQQIAQKFMSQVTEGAQKTVLEPLSDCSFLDDYSSRQSGASYEKTDIAYFKEMLCVHSQSSQK